ncbi:hypothetical protein ZIOFF_042884 [Zingiber officinale]|uniref:DNA topoisomerase I n=1 Tax=Zingiber officinale TaxID=94328 RepID=A0A8J5FU01_ZINOF|nr:hypothetical protein ZIOFF_042884 [Zingiber officinale]
MSVHGCIDQVMNDSEEDDEAPLVFRRPNSSSKQGHSTSALKKTNPQKDSSCNLVSHQIAQNGSISHSQNIISLPETSREKPTATSSNVGSLLPVQSINSSHHKLTTNNMRPKHEDELSVSDDDKPLSHRLNSASTIVQRKSFMDSEKAHTHSSVHKFEGRSTEKMDLDDPIIKHENFDDDKPLSFKYSTSGAVNRSASSHAAKAPQSQKPSLPHSMKPTSNNEETDDSEDEKPLLSRFQSKDVNGSGKKDTIIKHENFDDDKPLSFKNSTSGAVNRSASSHAAKAPQSQKPSLPHSMKPTSNNEETDDSEDEKPLLSRFQYKAVNGSGKKDTIIKHENFDDDKPLSFKHSTSGAVNRSASSHAAKAPQSQKPSLPHSMKPTSNNEETDDSEDEKPLLSRFQSKAVNGSGKKGTNSETSAPRVGEKRPHSDTNPTESSSIKKAKLSGTSVSVKDKQQVSIKKESKEDDNNDHIPIAQRIKSPSSNCGSISKNILHKTTSSSFKKSNLKMNKKKDSNSSKSLKTPPGSGGGQKWTTLVHNGVIFPPPYKPHGIKMLYKGQPVNLTPEQEEEKKIMKEEKLKQEEKYMWAIVDGVKEKVGNFRVEPPGLFRGRGEHPKVIFPCHVSTLVVSGCLMGKLKNRIKPRDITINIGKDAPIPECPIPGERWKEVKHDNTVTWLAFWNDPINPKEFKYVFLAASSSLKGQSDKEKYEKARLLKVAKASSYGFLIVLIHYVRGGLVLIGKSQLVIVFSFVPLIFVLQDYIQNIRRNYTRDFNSKDPTKRQIAVATYLIDKLALRAGNEKDDDEADTVGCCTLKVENVELVPPNKLKFDFLGKDSIRYLNTVEVEPHVYKAIGDFQIAKKSNGGKKDKGDDLFDLLDTSKLNAHLKELMPGLTAKVFRTYNASITLDVILNKETKDGSVPEKITVYQHANKEVAIICNHQRSVSKSHENQMSKLNEKINDLTSQRDELMMDLSRAKKGKPPLKDKEGKPKKNLAPEVIEKKIAQVDAKIGKMEMDKQIKEDLKTVALGTSKINYLDPRISVAWCKRHEVPIEKIFNKSLLAKFAWAMDVDPDFRF